MIKRAMGRALRENVPLKPEVARYLTTIPDREFETLMLHVDSIDGVRLSPALKQDILAEAARRAETVLLS